MNKSSCLLVDIKGISSIKIYNPYCFLNWSFVSWKGPLLFQAWSEKNSYWCSYFAPCLAETISVDQLGRSRLFGIHSQIEVWAIKTNTSKKLKETYRIEILNIYRKRFAILQTMKFLSCTGCFKSWITRPESQHITRKVYQSCLLFALLKIVLKKPLNRAKHYDAMPIQLFF